MIQGLFKILGLKKGPKFITVVSGLPRSGTSMMMKMLEAGGISPLIDNFRQADDDNPKGYYEFERVKKMPEGDFDWLQEAEGKSVKIISALLPHLPEQYTFRIVFMKREITEILASQKKMLIRRGEDPNKVTDQELTELFAQHLQQTNAWIGAHQHHVSCLRISYNSLLKNPAIAIDTTNEFLGGGLDTDAMATIVDPSLYRHRGEGNSQK